MADPQPPADVEGYVPFPDTRVQEYREEGYWHDLAFHEVLDRAGERHPGKPFAVGPHGETSYGEFAENGVIMGEEFDTPGGQ